VESVHKDNRYYVAFKAAERGLHALMKSRSSTLRELLVLSRDDPAAQVVATFQSAQADWFREKARLASEQSTSPTEASSSMEEKKVSRPEEE
jgi:biopolymer transport protein ExbB/TolQ